ncbi:hypothetical protein DEU56DRAFT_791346 [Suillus clintonianus]|uniref:uncharacterized protein n=1 Tax=Suillus clintonianus TaxID=1904413 RepID=UPI001B874E1C|nr:uncharacterized protein DEU56DRAFT_791346 [Suillus clintonianus]KAG2144354.1 hypothetical protein DEU56DRAFT_791346 [Suillus clintonianus]
MLNIMSIIPWLVHESRLVIKAQTYPFPFRGHICWCWNGARQKHPMSSILLQLGVKDMLLADCKYFLCSED